MGCRYQLLVILRWRATTLEFSPRHVLVIQKYAAGKDPSEIATRRKIKPWNYFANFKNGSVQTA
jgi:hypothetical protein